jgi:hypothetical protein
VIPLSILSPAPPCVTFGVNQRPIELGMLCCALLVKHTSN